ncbi:putative D-cysteine desulfhydrase [Helianthus annuus]|nr:putative D-cysteine desulfhydrase [Helianthus annuus]
MSNFGDGRLTLKKFIYLFFFINSIYFLKAKGLGYAMSIAEELKFVKDIAETTGVISDLYKFRLFYICLLHFTFFFLRLGYFM